jgi:multicomponent Na+:H+ antiporter subunit G
MSVQEVVAAVLLGIGTLFAFTAAVGVVRLPDVFARMHAATKASTFGALFTVAGAGVVLSGATEVTKLVLIGVFMLITAPAAAHMVSRAAHRAGTELGPQTVRDDLATAEAEHRSEAPRLDG